MQALAALTHAHGLGVVHRDLKPANLMLTDGGAVKIMDFGIARVSGSEHLTNVGFMMGTPAYMAPEQVLGHEVDARTDIYAMGVVLYRLTTAKLPFKGETPFALAQSQVNDPPTPVRMAREGLPSWLELVLGRALAKAPVERFQTAFEFRDALQRSLAGLPIPSLFDQTAPTGMMHTPAGLPSGAFAASAPVSGAIPTSGGTGAQASMTGSSTAPGISLSTAQTMMASSSTGAAPVSVSPMGSTGAVAQAPATPTAATAMAPAPQPVRPAAKNSNVMWLGIAAGVLILATAGYFMMRGAPSPPTPQTPAATASGGDAQPPTSPPDAGASSAAGTAGAAGTSGAAGTATQPASSTPAGTSPAPASAGGGAGASATGGATAPAPPPSSSNTPAGTRGTAAPSTAPATPTTAPSNAPAGAPAGAPARGDAGRAAATGRPGGAATAADLADALIVFSDAKLVTFEGRKGRDQDVILHFGSGEISVIPKKGGAALIAIPYKKVAHATYSHTKDPKWDPSLTGLPENADIPGFMRGSRNWLVLQWKTDSVVLDSNATEVLRTFEVRTGLKIDRPSDAGK
jgi:serine/threonine-protein kinase